MDPQLYFGLSVFFTTQSMFVLPLSQEQQQEQQEQEPSPKFLESNSIRG